MTRAANEDGTKARAARIIFVGPRRRYHSSHSGYETLIRFLGEDSEEVQLPSAVERDAGAVSSVLSENWRSRLVAEFGWPVVAKSIRAVYERALG